MTSKNNSCSAAVLFLALFWNLIAVDYVVWSFRDLWNGMVLHGLPYSILALLGITALSIYSTRFCWVYLAMRPVSLMATAGLILSFTPAFSAYVAGHLLSVQITLLG